jgi:hypothetical protein
MFLPAGWCRAELWCHLLSNKAFNQVWLVGSWNDFSCELTNGIMEGISCNESNDPKKVEWYPFFMTGVRMFQIPCLRTAQVIVVYSTKESQLMFPRDWQDG